MSLHSQNRSVTANSYSDGKVSRTAVSRYFKWRSTFSAGKLIPFWCDEMLPGQKKSVDMGELIRSITPLGPTMDNSFLELFFFAVPRRLLWDHWEEFIAGYNKEAWAQDVTYTAPKIKFKIPNKEVTVTDYIHSFLDYLPGAVDVCSLAHFQDDIRKEVGDGTEDSLNATFAIDAMFPRAYVKIWNDWFRSESVDDEYQLYTGDNDQYADEFAFNLLSASNLPEANKLHNRFTDSLPSPVKGPDVLIPMTNLQVGLSNGFDSSVGISSNELYFDPNTLTDSFSSLNFTDGDTYGSISARNVSNTIRMLRLATQTELLLARDARGGTRYNESIYSHFHVTNGDARLQRSEYLGSRQIPLQIMQVINNAQSATAPLGNVGGQSMTKDQAHYFSYSAKEHCIVFCVGCVRTNLSYSSGVRKMYQRFGRFDHIWPEFKHLGDVPLYRRELSTEFDDVIAPGGADEVFGYTPYGSELREGYNFNNGLFRPHVGSGSLAYLTYQEVYNADYSEDTSPTLSSVWLKQPADVISNTLTVQEGPQFYGLFEVHSVDVIPLDPTSDPGLMDHF